MKKFINGGYLQNRKTYVVSSVGIVSAIGAYLVGDQDLFTMLQTVFTLGGIYFLKQESSTKGKNNGTNSRKISK
ncbi:MAG: hypothetical protein IJV03_02545 [Alphaproteobacteria bacterium]|jgi:hypothetical protein|nr:hypothetical protein [Alphaproteobacteria bacterium]